MLKMKFKNYLSLIVLVIIIIWPISVLKSENEKKTLFFIIINSENSYNNKIDRGFRKVGLVYKGNSKKWADKIKATFFSRGANNPAQIEFYRKVLNMEVNEINSYWKKKAANGSYRPKTIVDIRKLINEISRNKGSISVIAQSEIEKLPAKIRVLYEY